MSNPEAFLPPGFRFHPTDEELILHYLKNRATSTPCPVSIIAEVDIYKFDPWNLPSKAMFGDREWYFFTPRDRKYPNGMRPNRAAGSGYWKATGTDKPIASGKENIGVKKALVFYTGKPPRGTKTNWIMHEYRLVDSPQKIHHHMLPKRTDSSMRLDDWVLCRIYQKSSNPSPSSDTPAVDREDSNIEETYFSGFPDITQQTNNDSKLPKLGSFPELLEDVDYSSLSRLLSDNPPDFSWQEPVGFDHQPNFHDNVPSLSGSLRRQRTPELYSDMSVAFNSSYKRQKSSYTPTNLDNQMDNLSYINHHMLMNSHPGFH